MAHEIYNSSFVYRGEPAWHGIGAELPEEHQYNMREAFRCAQADFAVETFALTGPDGEDMAKFAKGVRRCDTRDPIGVVGPSFEPLQWEAMADAYQPMLDARLATVETVGVLKGGSRLFALVKFGAPLEIVPGDDVLPYGLIVHAHDGTLSVKMGPTAIRVVCNNTVQVALTDKRSQLLSIKHRSGVDRAVRDAGTLIQHAHDQITVWADFARAMAKRDLNPAELSRFVKATFPERFTFKDPADALLAKLGIPVANEATPSEKFLAQFMDIFEGQGAGSKLPGVRGTLWGAFNAATELSQHHTAFRSPGTRTDSILFGSAADTARKAQKAARELLAA